MSASRKKSKKSKTLARPAGTGAGAKKRGPKKKAALNGKTRDPASNRFAGEPRVYRFWQDGPGFLVYAGGLWTGQGVHGDPDKDGEYKWMRARFGADGLEVSILTALPAPKKKGLAGLFARRAHKPGGEGKTETIHFPATSLEADLDLAAWQDGGHQLDLQAIDGERLYVVLRALGRDGRIEFAGPLKRE